MDSNLNSLAAELGRQLAQRRWTVATAESCTGGGVAAAITSVPGSSNWFGYGLVTYANTAKVQLLGVAPDLLAEQGAVSESVVRQMVLGALALSGADLAVAISGIAGPEGGTAAKPVGTVWFAWGSANGWLESRVLHFNGGREAIQNQAVVEAIAGLLQYLTLNKNTV